MKQTKIGSLTVILLFSAWILRGQGWVKNYHTGLNMYASVASRDNGFVSVGSFSTSRFDTLLPLSVIKADSNGNIIWKKDFNDINARGIYYSDYPNVFQIIQGNDNGYIIGVCPENSQSTRLFKLDEAGNIVWSRQYVVWNNQKNKQLIGNKTRTNYCLHSNYQMLRIANNGDLNRVQNRR